MLLQGKECYKAELGLCVLIDLFLYFTWFAQVKLEWTLLTFSVQSHFLALCPDKKSLKLSGTEC